MSDVGIGAAGPAGPLPPSDEARLRRAAAQLEGVFVEQLFKAMRETVPDGGLVDGGSGEEMFAGMLDQHLSGVAPEQWQSELGAALYRQLLQRAAVAAPVQDTSTVGGTT